MDKRILESLATCALYPYLKGGDSGSCLHDGNDGPNGAEFPDLIAQTIAFESTGRDPAPDFTIGFNMALQLGALIAENPTQSPDLGEFVARAQREARSTAEAVAA